VVAMHGAELCSYAMRDAGGCAWTRGCPGLAVAPVVISRLTAPLVVPAHACTVAHDMYHVGTFTWTRHQLNLYRKKGIH
jgi:hypothetical protein